MDLLFAGLVQNLGPDSVDMFPYKKKHVNWLTGTEPQWNKERGSFGWTESNVYVPEMSEQETKKMVLSDCYDYVFLDEREESFLQYLRLGLQHTSTKVVVVAGHDQFWNTSPEHVKNLYGKNFHMMFLDNWRDEWNTLPWARLINLSSNWDHFWDPSKRDELLNKKVYDLCFMGYNSHPTRDIVMTHIEKTWGHLNNRIVFERRPGTAEAFVSHREFFEAMAQSKICINLAGAAFGGRAMRLYQIPYVGSFMLSQVFKAAQLEQFVHGKHCMYFDTLEELDESITSMLRYDWLREKMARDGHEHAIRHHTSQARVRHVLDEVERG